MKATLDSALESEVLSVSFVPWSQVPARVRLPEPLDDPITLACLRQLRLPLDQLAERACSSGSAGGATVLLFSGCQRGAGCSTVALALAAASALQRSTLVIDGDLARTGLSTLLRGKERNEGWEINLGAAEPAGQWARDSGLLSFLPLSRPVQNKDEVFTRGSLAGWFAGLRDSYSLIVVDGGPALDTGARWAPWCDVAALICNSTRRASEDWSSSWDRLEEAGTRVLGLVETFVREEYGPACGSR